MPHEDSEPQRPQTSRADRLGAAHAVFDQQAGIASRRQLYDVGLRRWELRAELKSSRWARTGNQTVGCSTGLLSGEASWWRAILEVGSGAALDGATALVAAGLTGFVDDTIHVSMPKSGRPRSASGVTVHETRRRQADDLVGTGIPRVRVPVAAVRAALWARSNRQAALLLVMPVQQRLTTAEDLAVAFETVKRHRRRRLLLSVVADLVDGAQSLGELDFARLCREYGLPEPNRQVVCTLPGRTVYRDVRWNAYGVSVEIDGIHHRDPDHVVADAIRQNELVTRDGDVVLRIPVIGLRTQPEQFMVQVRAALVAGGWQPPVASEEVA